MGMVYIAGAIDLQTTWDKQQTDPRDTAEAKLLFANVAVYRPDKAIRASDISVDGVARSIRELNYAAIEACAGMIAIVGLRMSVGTVMDMMKAREAGIPVVVVLHEIRRPSYLVDWPCYVGAENAVRALLAEMGEPRGA